MWEITLGDKECEEVQDHLLKADKSKKKIIRATEGKTV
jgi:hypothetical protein